MNPFYWACNVGFAGSLGLWADYQREGQSLVPKGGPLLVIANHQSNMDPPIVARSIDRRAIFPAKRELFKFPLFSLLLHMWGAFPLARGEADSQAYRKILSTLAEPDGCVTLFPEGTRSRGGGLRQSQRGPANIAMRTGVTVVPLGITGTHVLGGVLRALYPTATIRVKVGRPFKVVDAGRDRREAVGGAAVEMMARIAELLPESDRGAYADAVNLDRIFTRDLPAG